MLGDRKHGRKSTYATVICYNPCSGKCRRINIHEEVMEEVKEMEIAQTKKKRKKKLGAKKKKKIQIF